MLSRLTRLGDLIAGRLEIVCYVRREVARIDLGALMDRRGDQPQNGRAIIVL
jgi:hypothetical protein